VDYSERWACRYARAGQAADEEELEDGELDQVDE